METYLISTPGQDIEAMIEGLEVPDEKERKIAEYALFAQGGKAIKPLVHALQVDDPAMRMEAARVLGDLRLPEAAPALIQALGDRDEGVRTIAVHGLVDLREDALRPILERLVDGPMPDMMREGIFQALRGLEDYGVLRGDLKRIVDVIKPAMPYEPAQNMAKELLIRLH